MVRTNFESLDICSKVVIGPKAPRPGPTLLKVVDTAAKAVSKSFISIETIINKTIKIKKENYNNNKGIGIKQKKFHSTYIERNFSLKL